MNILRNVTAFSQQASELTCQHQQYYVYTSNTLYYNLAYMEYIQWHVVVILRSCVNITAEISPCIHSYGASVVSSCYLWCQMFVSKMLRAVSSVCVHYEVMVYCNMNKNNLI